MLIEAETQISANIKQNPGLASREGLWIAVLAASLWFVLISRRCSGRMGDQRSVHAVVCIGTAALAVYAYYIVALELPAQQRRLRVGCRFNGVTQAQPSAMDRMK